MQGENLKYTVQLFGRLRRKLIIAALQIMT